jgi:glycosyltransferase involved in cell wall biosynthesis
MMTPVDVIVIDKHPEKDGRITRHVKYLINEGLTVYRVHYNLIDPLIEGGKFSEFGEKGSRINIFRFKGKFRTLYFLIYCFRHKIAEDCYSALNNLNFDSSHFIVIHIHDPHLLPLARMLIRDNRIKAKIVYDRHELYEKFDPFFGIHIHHIIEKLFKGSISGVVTVSERHNSMTQKVFPNASIIAVPNYPLTSAYNSNLIFEKIQSFNPHSRINMVYIGSLNNLVDRDIDLLLKIGDRILTSLSNVTFFIGGMYNLDSRCRKKIEDLSKKFRERFLFLGPVPSQKTIELTQVAHIGFFLLRPETPYWVMFSPNKVYEYLICGTIPIIRADIDHAEVISNCGLLFNRYDSDDFIINSIMNLVKNPEGMRESMKQARELSVHYTWESVACRYIDLYNALLEQIS